MARAQLTIRVFLEDQDGYEVVTRLADHNMWDVTRAKHKWPTPTEGPLTWLGFLAWTASRRTGVTTLTWEQFLAATEGVERVDEDDEGEVGADVDPTRQVPGPG